MTYNLKIENETLKNIEKALKDKGYYVEVGILGGKYDNKDTTKKPITIANIGLIQEFGSIKNNIPARSFIREPLNKHLSDEIKLSETLKKAAFSEDPTFKYEVLGGIARNVILDSFQSLGDGTWAPNAPVTIKKKKSSHPLIDTGKLRKSIDYKVVKNDKV